MHAYALKSAQRGVPRGANGTLHPSTSLTTVTSPTRARSGGSAFYRLGDFSILIALFGVFQVFFQVCDVIFKRLGFLTPAWPPPRRPPEAARERSKRMSPRSIFIIPKVPSRVHGHFRLLFCNP